MQKDASCSLSESGCQALLPEALPATPLPVASEAKLLPEVFFPSFSCLLCLFWSNCNQ